MGKITETESKMVVARDWEGGGQGGAKELLFNGYRVSVYKMKRVMEMDKSCAMLRICLVPLTCALKNG